MCATKEKFIEITSFRISLSRKRKVKCGGIKNTEKMHLLVEKFLVMKLHCESLGK